MPDMERVTVRVDMDTRALSTGVRSVLKDTGSLSSGIGKIGADADKAATQGQAAFSKFSQAIKGAQADAAKGIDAKANVDMSGLDRFKSAFSSLRSDVARGLSFAVKADEAGLSSLKSAISGLRSEASQGATFALKADETGLSQLESAVQGVRNEANQGAVFSLKADESGLSSLESRLGGLKDIAAGVALGNIGADAASAATEGLAGNLQAAAEASGRFQATLGASTGEAEAFKSVGLDVYSSNWGDSLGEVNAAVSTVAQGLGSMADTSEIETLTTDALILSDAFGFDIQESVEAVRQMMQNFGVDGQTAFDLITSGAQQGANSSGDLLDTMREYSPFFSQLGFTADQAMATLVAGTQEGIWNTDKLADAIKEFSIRAIDGSDTTADAFQSLGMDADAMAQQIAAGGPAAQTAMQQVVDALAGVEDPVEQNRIGVELFGTQWEDIGPAILSSLDQGESGLSDFEGSTADAGDALSNNFGAKLSTVGRSIQTFLIDNLGIAVGSFGDFSGILGDAGAGIMGLSVVAPKAAAGLEMIGLSGWSALAPLLGIAALGAIAIDIAVHFPEMTEAFSSAYGEAREGGSGYARSFVEGFNAAVDETTILGTLGGWVDSAMAWLKEKGAAPEVSLWDVLTGDATVAEGAAGGSVTAGLIAGLQSAYDGAVEWLSGAVPEVSLWDVLTGEATVAEGAEGGSVGAGILVSLQEGYNSVMEWLGGLAPETSLWDVLTGQAAEGEESPLMTTLTTAWESVTEWLANLVPEVSLWDVLTGQAEEGEESPLMTALTTAWESVTEWLANLVPEVSLWDVLTGQAEEGEESPLMSMLSSAWDSVTEWLAGLEPEVSLWDVITGQANAEDSDLLGPFIDFFTTLYNDYFLYYLGSDGVITTAVGDFFSTLIDTYWTPYFGTDGTLITTLSEFFSVLYNDWFLYYLGSDGVVATAVSDFFTYLVDTYWTPYFGADGTLITTISDFFTVLYNDWFLYYLGSDGVVATAVADFFTYLVDTYWTPYFGTDGTLITTISDFFTMLYNDYFLYYLGSEGVVVTAVSDAWTAITEGVSSFVAEFGNTLANGIADGVNAAIGFMQGLLDAVDSVLEAIGASTLGVTLPTVSVSDSGFTAAYHGAVTDHMADGGRRGGAGTQGANSRLIEWNEQSNGREWWIATGDANKRRQRRLLAGAAGDLGMGVTPMAGGGGLPGIPIWRMAIGGGTDVGPGGLSGMAADVANAIMSQFGVWANTYVGGATPHGSLHGNIPENTFDFWNDAGFGALDPGTGDAIMQYLFDNYGSDLDTVIWQGQGTGPSGAFYDDNHYDHLHASVGGSGLSNTAGVIANMLFQKAKSLWDAAMAALGTPSFGDGQLWDAVETYVLELPSKVWNWILTKIPRGWGGGAGGGVGSLSGDIQQMLSQGINAAGWSQEDLAALTQLWQNESGFNPNAVNPDSGAYGIPQINPSSWGTPVPLGDAASQIEWGIDYIADRYGSASEALDFWLANGWYARGGSTSGDITQTFSQSGSGTFDESKEDNTGQTQGPGAHIRMRTRNKVTSNQTSTGGGGGGGQGTPSSSTPKTPAKEETPAAGVIGYAIDSVYGDLIRQAADVWNAAGANLQESTSPQWTVMDQDTGGYGGLTNPDGTIYLDPYVMGYAEPGDQLSLAVHELGHALGLDHTSESSIMNTDMMYDLDGALTDWDIAQMGGAGAGGFHKGGVIPGTGDTLALAQGGERVLPRSLNRGFERLASSVQLWSAKGGGNVAGDGIASSRAGSTLDEILGAIRDGNESETPVRMANVEEFTKGVVAGALAAQASEAGAEINYKHLAEGIKYAKGFTGSTV